MPDWELRVRERLIAIQSEILDAFWTLSHRNMDGTLTYGYVYAKLEEIRNSARTAREFLSNYLSKNPALSKVFGEFLSSVETHCAYYGGKAESSFALPITLEDWERLRALPEIWKKWISEIILSIAPRRKKPKKGGPWTSLPGPE